MATFTKYKLGEICDLQQGLCINRKSKHLVVERSNLPLLRITDLINNKQEQYIDTELVPPQFIADNKSLIYTRTGQVGLVFRNRKGIVHNNCFKIMPRHGLDIDFLYYSLNQKTFYNTAVQIASKAAQPDLTHTSFKSMEISVPGDLLTQTRIASILSAYDDLIENNERRIKVLEEMAQLLYIEWFVKFKFPGHEKVKMVDSGTEYGMIPDGWEVRPLSEVMDYVRGRSYSSEQISDDEGEYYIVNLKCFNRSGGYRLDGAKYYTGPINADQLLTRGDVVVAVTDMTNDRAVIARPARVPNIHSHKITLSADVVKIISSNLPSPYIYYLLMDYRFTEATKNKANGANVLHLKPDHILEYRALLPTPDLIKSYSQLCGNLTELIDHALEQNQTLAQMRDLLIPQLVTGKRILK